MKKILAIVSAIIVFLLLSIDLSVAKHNNIPSYAELDPSDAPSSYMLSVPQRVRAAGFCYLEALAMQIAFYRPDISMGKVFAYGMFGAGVYWCDTYPPNTLLINKMFTTGHTLSVIQGFGISYVLGAGSEQGYSDDTYEHASGKLFFEGGQQALGYLKAAIADGRPVQVHLDIGYMEVNGVSCHPIFNLVEPGSSHFMLVVGYDENNVYFNETIAEEDDPEDNELREFPVPNSAFLEAWRMAGEINKGTALQGGSYWMMFFTHKDGSEIVETKTTDEIIADHKADAIKNSDVILSHIDCLHKNGEQDWEYQKIGIIRNHFSDFLSELGMTAASVAYADLADWYDDLRNHGLSYQKSTLENTIATLEDYAAEKLGKLNTDKDEDDDGDGVTENQGDCDDNDATIYPGTTEICWDGEDNNCDGTVDEGCDPYPDIKANGSDVPINITLTDNLSITIELLSGGFTGVNADWWLVADTPFGWYHYQPEDGSWAPDLIFSHQGPLFNLGEFEVLNISGLPAGDYTVYFGVDLDQAYYDFVKVNIE